MGVLLKDTPQFYSGPQKYRLLADSELRLTLIFVLFFGLSVSPAYLLFPAGLGRAYAYHAIFIIPMLTFTLVVFQGNLQRASWMWYAGFCVLYLASVPRMTTGGSTIYYMPFALCIICGVMTLRGEPRILERLGYSAPLSPVKELFFYVAISFVVAIFVYVAMVHVAHFTPKPWTVVEFSGTLLYTTLEQAMFIGVLYGVFMKRALETGNDPGIPILANILLTQIWWSPAAFTTGTANVGMNLAGNLGAAAMTHVPIGLTFYFCRSSRVALFCFITYSMLTKIYLR